VSSADASVRVGGGRALERTVLAWNRSALAIVATAGLLIKVAADQGSLATGLLVGGVLVALALAVWLYGRAAYRRADSGRSGVFAPNVAVVGLTAVSTTTGVLAAAIVLAG
jgi:uncharacterized membrane protein YidH (DUF202 family)